MAKRMLIDAVYEDEQRVVVLDGEALVEADFHSTTMSQIKGNIYLARVTRVEPSLQAAFVDFGKGKHGFLPFSEIHPDYFQIPVADREALLEDVQAALAKRQPQEEEAEEPQAEAEESPKPKRTRKTKPKTDADAAEEVDTDLPDTQGSEKPKRKRKTKAQKEAEARTAEVEQAEAQKAEAPKPKRKRKTKAEKAAEEEAQSKIADKAEDSQELEEPSTPKKTVAAVVETEVVYEETAPEAPGDATETPDEQNAPKSRSRSRRRTPKANGADTSARKSSGRVNRRRDDDTDDLSDADFEARLMTRAILGKKYKIQEVIKRNQVILVQAAKEERGDKGAALTTYLSLPGRYCVLMPNTHRGGGVSRRIADGSDRKRLKSVLDELDLAPSMSLIVRTAGADRTKQEIKRDFAYLTRTWDEIREKTLSSFAPALVYDEANLIKRAIRDVYTSDTQEVMVAGEGAYKAAKAFMKTLTPSHGARVKQYKDEVPLFQAHDVEGLLESLNRPNVRLPSGGYLVFNQTEALVAVDVNSGKATKERNIEETALKTNLEAARETARQLRLRDLAGLVVIDFIDMDETKNVAQVERALKEALKPDRARIQVGRISQFGLLELSRQRLRPSVAEATMAICPTCHGTGYIKSNSGNARGIIRQIETALAQGGIDAVTVFAHHELALTLLNEQRSSLARLESAYDLIIEVQIDSSLGPTHFRCVLDRQGRHEAFGNDPEGQSDPRTSRRRNRGGRGGRDRSENADASQSSAPQESAAISVDAKDEEDEGERRRRRRGKRGGRRRGKRDEADAQTNEELASASQDQAPDPAQGEQPALEMAPDADLEAEKPAKKPRKRTPKKAEATGGAAIAEPVSPPSPPAEPQAEPQTKPTSKAALEAQASAAPPPKLEDTPPSDGPKRRGWWSRVRGS